MGNFAGKWKSVKSKNGILPDGYEYEISQNRNDVFILGKKDGKVMNIGYGKVYDNKIVITWWNSTGCLDDSESNVILVELDSSGVRTNVVCVLSGQEKSFGNWERM